MPNSALVSESGETSENRIVINVPEDRKVEFPIEVLRNIGAEINEDGSCQLECIIQGNAMILRPYKPDTSEVTEEPIFDAGELPQKVLRKKPARRMDAKRPIGIRIAQVRRIRDMTERQFGDKIGQSEEFVTRLEKGQEELDDDLILEIASALDLDLDELLTGQSKLTQTGLEMVRNWLEETRQEQGLSMVQLGDISGMGQTFYNLFSRGLRVPVDTILFETVRKLGGQEWLDNVLEKHTIR